MSLCNILFSPNIIFSLKIYLSRIHTHSSFLLVSFVWYTILYLLLSTLLYSHVSLASIHLWFHFSICFLSSNNYYTIYDQYITFMLWSDFPSFLCFFYYVTFPSFCPFLGREDKQILSIFLFLSLLYPSSTLPLVYKLYFQYLPF